MVRQFLLLFSVFVISAYGNDSPSFRSSLNEGGKPILRNGPSQTDFGANSVKHVSDQPSWVENLRSDIHRLVAQYGYDEAKQHISKLVDDTEYKEKVLLRVEVNRDGHSDVKYKNYASILRSADPPPTPAPDPEWVRDFKAFIKVLVHKYGRAKLDGQMHPVIKYVEKMKGVHITDIDVNEFGEVAMSYVEKPKSPVQKILEGVTHFPFD